MEVINMYEEELFIGREINCSRCNGLYYTYDSGAPVCNECYDSSRRKARSDMLDMINFLTQ